MSENVTPNRASADTRSANCEGCSSTGSAADSDVSWKKIAGTLTGEEMKKYGIFCSPKQGEEIPSKKYQGTTFDLRLGEGHYLYDVNTEGHRRWRCVYIGEEERFQRLNSSAGSERFERPDSDRPNTLTIPAFGSALIQLYEIVDTLTVAKEEGILVVGRFDLKLSRVHQGLISQQATQVEPCYCGRLFCFLHNLSNKEIELKYKDDIATIEFSYVSCAHNADHVEKVVNDLIRHNSSDERYGKDYCDGKGIVDIRYFWADERLPEECGLWSLRDTLLRDFNEDNIVEKIGKSYDIIKKIADIVTPKIDQKRTYLVEIIRAVAILGTVMIGGWYALGNVEARNEKKFLEIRDELGINSRIPSSTQQPSSNGKHGGT